MISILAEEQEKAEALIHEINKNRYIIRSKLGPCVSFIIVLDFCRWQFGIETLVFSFLQHFRCFKFWQPH